ncbi:MAG: addiction module toxin RelE [Bacteroidetes bacterium CG18_big_fil_WC_8_21_14_2_50_41_14]|nr:MAG: addiction module toxin RelE [Bacteroidetes bacterium CG18_big_fil_WC_8_21_14_2_50_41_14]PJB59657.1 MAG: type II toxin-antitoxin system RelE/ParE family toxin [Bacteroidetes bacterium CG_4_9_14_3_um_filter_41_19]
MVKFKIDWSIEARLDLIDILDFYIKRNKSNSYSIKLNTKINRSIKLLSNNPFLGIPTDFDSVGALITGDYQIIYEIFDQLILIIMIWDCRRDPEDKIIDQRIK